MLFVALISSTLQGLITTRLERTNRIDTAKAAVACLFFLLSFKTNPAHFTEIMMPQAIQSDYQAAARLRWPHAEITGDGEWVFLIECYRNKAARLYHDVDSARAGLRNECGHAHCLPSKHSVVRLKLMNDIGPKDKYDRD